MKSSRHWLLFSLIRLGIFAVALAGLLLLQVNVWIAAFGAALIGFCISYIFLRGPRDAVAKSMVRQKASGSKSRPDRDLDNDIENEALDRLERGQQNL
ncbi:MAG: hypothetical protein JWN80_2571 [Microbacteriaceae bacterium]|nr:hypothetical protein [Microbacteriaceae bacterium]